jgi:hypothetical protein
MCLPRAMEYNRFAVEGGELHDRKMSGTALAAGLLGGNVGLADRPVRMAEIQFVIPLVQATLLKGVGSRAAYVGECFREVWGYEVAILEFGGQPIVG